MCMQASNDTMINIFSGFVKTFNKTYATEEEVRVPLRFAATNLTLLWMPHARQGDRKENEVQYAASCEPAVDALCSTRRTQRKMRCRDLTVLQLGYVAS